MQTVSVINHISSVVKKQVVSAVSLTVFTISVHSFRSYFTPFGGSTACQKHKFRALFLRNVFHFISRVTELVAENPPGYTAICVAKCYIASYV